MLNTRARSQLLKATAAAGRTWTKHHCLLTTPCRRHCRRGSSLSLRSSCMSSCRLLLALPIGVGFLSGWLLPCITVPGKPQSAAKLSCIHTGYNVRTKTPRAGNRSQDRRTGQSRTCFSERGRGHFEANSFAKNGLLHGSTDAAALAFPFASTMLLPSPSGEVIGAAGAAVLPNSHQPSERSYLLGSQNSIPELFAHF